jgi:hypothetical protein
VPLAYLTFHGIHTSPERETVLPMCPVRSVTYVSGRSSYEPDFRGRIPSTTVGRARSAESRWAG